MFQILVEVGTTVMNTTKQGCGTAPTSRRPSSTFGLGEQQESDLLFPSITGGFRSRKVLNDPLAELMVTIAIDRGLTPRGMRRTFNDLARAAGIERVLIRSVSGHLTEEMPPHESIAPAEQRPPIGKVIDLTEAAAEVPRLVPRSPMWCLKQKGRVAWQR